MFPIPLSTLNDQQRHDYILNKFVLNREPQRIRRDIDVIRDNHQFLWDDDNPPEDSWEVRLAKRYYNKLFKEYCIADLTRYKENKIALRWRTEAEVVTGKGQFQCGSRKCEERETLRSWEVNFAYQEHGHRKNALVKLRLCPEHTAQLNFTSRKREVKRLKRVERQQLKEEKHQKRRSKKTKRQKHSRSNASEDEGKDEESIKRSSMGANIEDNQHHDIQEREARGSVDECTVQAELLETDVWSKKREVEIEVNTRETDFENYLHDLLL